MTETDHEELAAARAAFDSHESSQDAVVLAIPTPRESVRRHFDSIEGLCAAEDRKRELRLALLADLPAGVWLGGVA